MPEVAPDTIQGAAIVVIQPGSYNLRIGRAADAYPHTIQHCIARRRKQDSPIKYEDKWLVRPEFMHSESRAQQKTGLKLAEEAIQYRPTSTGQYRQPTSYKQVLPLNAHSKGEVTQIPSNIEWTDTHHKPPYLIGEKAFYVNPKDCYNLHWPFRYGRFNIHSGPGGSLTAVSQDLEDIWGEAIQGHLDIPLKDLKHYRAVLLIPDMYERSHVRSMLDILIERLGFGAAFAVQESVCATFGAGVPSACVIDVGDQKTSVCCVEDGLSHKQTRLCMEYGGADLTRCLYALLARVGFPYKECDLNDRFDAQFLMQIKENLLHMDHDESGINEHVLQLLRPSRNVMKFAMHLGDEVVQATMCFFYPDIFGLRGKHLHKVHRRGRSDPEDIHDEEYLQMAQSRQEAAAKQNASKKKSKKSSGLNTDELNEEMEMDETNLMMMEDDEDTNDPTEAIMTDTQSGAQGAAPTTATRGPKKWVIEEEDHVDLTGLVGIDQAALLSIDKCDNDEMKKRMYSTIVVVGGGVAKFRGVESWIKYAVWTRMPPAFRLALETMDVICSPKEIDPMVASWKGGAILSCLDTAQELWIRQREWNKLGVKILRERAPFVW